MGEKETATSASRLAGPAGASALRPGDPIPDIDVSPGGPPEPAETAVVKSKSNITNN